VSLKEVEMHGAFTSLLVVEIAITAIFIAMWFWRSFLDLKEDDHLLLDEAEAHLQREQVGVRSRVDALSRYIVFAGVAWGLLAITLVAGWIALQLHLL
jgi:hypothetical protein